jgi:hypothetical protein
LKKFNPKCNKMGKKKCKAEVLCVWVDEDKECVHLFTDLCENANSKKECTMHKVKGRRICAVNLGEAY